jgi:hypothetical protein
MNVFDRMTGWFAERYQYASYKFRIPDKAPPYIRAELADMGVQQDIWEGWSRDKQAQVAARISWIYSNIFRISNEVSAADFRVIQKGSNQRDIDHPLEAIMDYPNEFFDGISLLRYTIWGLSLGEYGGFWYLAPNKVTGELEEIWPIPIDRLTPIKHSTRFISHYEYKPKRGGKKLRIRPEYIVRFFYSHPWDLWRNFTPLEAATMAMSVYGGITTSQRDLYNKGRGVPLSVISVDPNIGNEDFAIVRQQLRDDWESERRVAVTRAGSMNIGTVGISNRDLQVIEAQNFNRDEIDAVFMGGIPWRSDQFLSGDGLREANKQVKEVVIHPLHKMIEKQIYLGIIARFYDQDLRAKFDDIRAQDRSIQLQERNVYWRAKTVDEARMDLGLDPFPAGTMLGDDHGDLPLSLSNNPAFIMAKTGLSTVPEEGSGDGGEKDEVGNLPGVRDEEALTTDLATGGEGLATDIKSIDARDAIYSGMREELKRYKRVMLKEWRKNNDQGDLLDRQFDTNVIMPIILDDIKNSLPLVQSEEDIQEIFDRWINQ